MLVAVLNDTHAGARNGSQIFIDYQEAFYEEVFFPYLVKHGIKKILHLGDYMEHRKFMNIKVVDSNRKHFVENLVKHDIHMDIIPGNHDVYYKSTNKLSSLDLIFTGYEDHVTLYHDPIELNYDGFKIALIPWISPENEKECMDFIKKSKAPMCAGHFEFVGFEMHPGQVAKTGIGRKDFLHFNQVISGHYHTKSSISNIMYLGSQMEFTQADCDDPKYFHVIDTATGDIKQVHNHITLFAKMTYDDELYDYKNFDFSIFDKKMVKLFVQSKKDPYAFDVFIDNINRRPIHDLKISESFAEFGGDAVEGEIKFEETTELMDRYIDEVATPLNKSKLKDKLKNLYREAQAIEYE